MEHAWNFKENVVCRDCGVTKNWKDFPFDKKKNKRHGTRCNQCGWKKVVGFYRSAKDKYRAMKKDTCETCGFRGHSCQLDINHIDGNHDNNNPENIQTLCSNCHRLVTFEKKHGMYQYKNGHRVI